MKKSLTIALFFSVSLVSMALADEKTSSNFKLNETLVENYKIKEKTSAPITKPTGNKTSSKPNIIKEEIPDGYIEKLLSEDGLVIAEKRVVNNEIIERIVNDYHPNKTISKKIIFSGEDNGFYVEEYYPNGKLSREVGFINDRNRIGVEKIYDIKGVLRKEIPWEEIDAKTSKNNEERITKRQGSIKTYYPNGKIAAIFSIGKKGENVFYNIHGKIIRHITKAEILDFSKEDIQEDCAGIVLNLKLEELVELYEDEGDISYNKCGLPYRENFIYEISDTYDRKNSKISFDETGSVRKITPYLDGYKEGKEQKFDKNGNLIAEITYKKSQKEGPATGYFPTGEVAFRKTYKNNLVTSNLTCYFPSGEEAAVIPYVNGKKEGVAKVSSPEPKGIKFRKGKILGSTQKQKRKLVSKLDTSSKENAKCLKLDEKISSINEAIHKKQTEIENSFVLNIPQNCEDLSSFVGQRSRFVCYKDDKVLASYPASYTINQYAIINYFYDNSLKLYDIPYNKKKRQGIAKAYNPKQRITKELTYDLGELKGASHTYYNNGVVEKQLYISDDKERKLLNSYDNDSNLLFSLNYEKSKKHHAYINENDKNKDTYVNYYEGLMDNIKEVNHSNPLNYIEYDLALKEYFVYKDNKKVKEGKICDFAKEILTPPEPKASSTLSKEDDTIKNKISDLDKEMKELQQAKSSSSSSTNAQTEQISPNKETKAHDSVVVDASEKELKTETTLKTPATLEPTKDTEPKNSPISAPQKVEIKDTIKEEITEDKPKAPQKVEISSKTNSEKSPAIDIPPIILPEDAPIVEGIEPLEEIAPNAKEYKLENAIITSKEEIEENNLKAQNIGPVEKPSKQELTTAVEKETINTLSDTAPKNISDVKDFYYPNGNKRKTVKTLNGRTQEIKEYSKTGLLITDTIYNSNNIIIEKYYGTGEIRRKTSKNYEDNPIISFDARIDFYSNGKPRYEINRLEDTLLFKDKNYQESGSLQQEQQQTSPLTYTKQEYDEFATKIRETIVNGANTIITEFDANNKVTSFSLNNKKMPENLASQSQNLLKDNQKLYNSKGVLEGEFIHSSAKDTVIEYYPNKKTKTEIVFYPNGEISVKSYLKDGTLDKFAYLSPDGKLHLQKPEVRVIPSYRERYWINYNNPNWIENVDKYSITSIIRLTLDVSAYMLAELELEVPEILKKIYSLYTK